MYINLLKKALLGILDEKHEKIDGNGNLAITKRHHIQLYMTDNDFLNGNGWAARAYSMIGIKRMDNIENLIKDIIENKIEGDFIETGVWRGGATIFMNGINTFYNLNRKIFVADSFEGLPKPDPKYPEDASDKLYRLKMLKVDLDTVQNNFKRFDLLNDNVIFIKGFFEHSLKDAPIEKLSLMRLDGDMYSSTIQVLEQLYDKLSIGGYVIIDDYGLPGAYQAVHDFIDKNKLNVKLITIDTSLSIYWKKE